MQGTAEYWLFFSVVTRLTSHMAEQILQLSITAQHLKRVQAMSLVQEETEIQSMVCTEWVPLSHHNRDEKLTSKTIGSW
jgi:hypothetical protein